MKALTFVLMVILLIVYAIVGGVILRYIEVNKESEIIEQANSTIYGIINSRQCLQPNDTESFQNIVKEMIAGGVLLRENATAFLRPRFDIRSSIMISCGLTAGFGFKNAVPVTVGGKIFNAFYSLCTGFYHFFIMYIFSDLFDILLKVLYTKMMLHFPRKKVVWFFHFRQLILTIVGLILFVIIPAAIINSIESSNFGESLYFSLTYVLTIGFGDYSPGSTYVQGRSEDFIEWYRMFVGFWLLLAVMWFVIIIYQFSSVMSDFIWETTDEIMEEKIDQIKDVFKKGTKRHSVRQRNSSQPVSNTTPGVDNFAANEVFTVLGQESTGDVSVIRIG